LLANLNVGGRKISTVERAQSAIFLLMPSCRASLESVSENLAVHPRHLQRLLESEGETFGSVLNRTRREMARRYLGATNHSIAEIALLLGYSTPSSFSRWFSAEFGKSPAAWRNDGQLHQSIAAA
jgi:AraC-like DNA-binding protein